MYVRFKAMIGPQRARWWRASFIVAVALVAASPVWGAVYNFAYDEVGRLTGVVDDTGNMATYTYDAAGNITAIGRGSAAVSVMSFAPGSGSAGTSVTISGTGFSATASQNTVKFNGVVAAINSASANQLVVQVPTGATTGNITVTSPSGSATSSTAFTVAQGAAPVISGFTPTIGTPGTAVTVNGSNFQAIGNQNNLTFNTRLATVSAATAGTLTTTVPGSGTSGRLALTTPFGQAVSSQDFFVPPPPRTVTDVALTGRMTIGSSQTVSLTAAGKIGLILFDATAGQRVSLLVSSSSVGACGSGSIQLIGAGGSVLGSANLCSGSFVDPAILPVTGTYTLLIAPYSTATGSLTFTLNEVPPDVSGTITIGGAAATLTTTVSGQDGSLTFNGTAGQRVSLATSQTSNVCYKLSLVSPDRTNLYGPTSTCGAQFVDPLTLPLTGTYTIRMQHWGTTTGSLTFTLYEVPPDVTGTITIGGPSSTLTTTVPGQDGRLTFNGTVGQRLSLKTGPNTMACYTLSLVNPDGTNLYGPTDNCGAQFLEPMTLPATGTYTIRLQHSKAITGSVTFALYEVPPDVTGTITIGGAPVTLTTTVPGQDGSLTFSGTSGQVVSLLINQNTIGAQTLTIAKPDGTNLYGPTSIFSVAFVEPMTLPATGTYTIRMQHNSSGTTGSLTFTLYEVPPDATGAIAIGGSSAKLTTTVPGQNGSLTFNGTAGQIVSMKVDKSTIQLYKLSILKPDGTVLFGPNTAGIGDVFVDPLTLPVSGAYTIRMQHSGSSTGSLTFTLYEVPPDVTGTITIGGSSATLTTTVPGQDGRLTFIGTAGQRVTVVTSQNTIGCFKMAVTNPDGTNLYGPSLSCGSSSLGPMTLPATGTYTVRMLHSGAAIGSLTFTVNLAP